MTRHLYGIFPAAVIVAFHLACTPGPVSGPSTEEGNPQIVAVVVDSLNNPVPNATVTAYRIPPATDTLQPPSTATVVAKRLTDATGRSVFDILPEGTYTLEATDPTAAFSALSADVTIGDSGTGFTDTLILEQPGGIAGVVSRGGVPGVVASQNTNLIDAAIMVIIQELGQSFITPQTGEYSFPTLPPGTYTVTYYATDGFFSAKQSIRVASGKVTTADTVILTPVPRLLPPRGFVLNTSEEGNLKTVTLTWQKVAFDSLRWYEVERFDLSGPFDTVFTTTDTIVVDTVSDIPSGTVLNYVVRSVDRAFNRSANAGPLEVVVE